MNKEFIKYEEALTLKELGFDEPCIATYTQKTIGKGDRLQFFVQPINANDDFTFVSAPLYQQAFKWFRDKHKYWNYIYPYIHNKDWNYHIQYYDSDIMWGEACIKGDFKTYEEAELACLKKLIEIVKEKNNGRI